MELRLQRVGAHHPTVSHDGRAALHDIDLHVRSGEHVAVIGSSGAGKTTLLHVLACALAPSSGVFLVDGHAPWRLPGRALRQLRGRLFLAPQVPPLPPRQRAVTAVLAGRLPAMGLLASVRSLFYPSDIPAAYDALARFALEDKLFDRVDRLSGGERQRVGLARALVAPAQCWLIDEPLSALDPLRAAQAIGTLVDEARARRVTCVATLHQVDMALAHFPRIVGLRDGRIAFDLPTEQVSAAHVDALYAHAPARERSDPSWGEAPSPTPVPVAMHCR